MNELSIYDQVIAEEADQAAAPAAPAPGDFGVYDQVMAEERDEQARAAQAVLSEAVKVTPEHAGDAKALSDRLGAPLSFVEADIDRYRAIERERTARDVISASPILRRQLMDPAFAKLAHEDIEALGLVERIARQMAGGALEVPGRTLSGLGNALDIAQRNMLGAFASAFLPAPMSGTTPTAESLAGPMLGQDWRDVGGKIKAYAQDDVMIPRSQRGFADDVAGGLGQFAAQIAMLPFDRGAGMYAQGVDIMADKIENDPASQGAKDAAMLAGGAILGVTEKWAIDRILGPMAVPLKNKMAAALARIGIAGAAEGGQEMTESILMDLVRVGVTNPNAEVEIGGALYEGGVGATVGAIARVFVESALHVRSRGAQGQADAEESQRLADLARDMAAAAQAIRITQIAPDSVEQYLQQVTEGGPLEELYVGADVLEQLGLTQRVAELSPAIAEQLATVGQDGGMIRITTAELAAKLGPAGVADQLFDHLRPGRPDAMSKLEAEAYLQTLGERMEEELSVDLGDVDQRIADDLDLNAYRDYVVAQLQGLGRPDLAPAYRAYGELQKAMIGALASRAGLTPRQLLERKGLLRVAGENGVTQPPAELRPELASVDVARSELDAARRAFDDAFNAGGAELPIKAVRESSSKLAQSIDAAFGGELAIVADQLGGGRIELVRASDGSGWVVWRHNEAGEVERGDVFTDRVSAIKAFLGDAELAGMSFTADAAAGPQAAPAVSPIAAAREAAEAAAAEVAAFEAATDQGQEIDADAYWAALDRQTNALRGLQAELEALPDDGFALEAATPMGMVMSLTASAQQPGKWQLTRFDQAGQPWGDTQYETKGEALREFLSDADVSTVRDFGGQFNQRARPFGGEEVARAPLDTVRTAWQEAGIDFTLVESGDVVTVSKIVVPEGAREAGVGTRALEQLVAWADANGKHLALTPSADFGGNAKRLTAFYKRFGFKENNGKSRVFSVSEGMIRENPNGKVLYSFAGQNAETADVYRLVDAKERLAKGEDKERVRRETGWFRGVDGRWRFEITDDGASIKTQGMPSAGSGMVMSDILDHPKLFAAYPDLEFMRVTFVDNAGFGGKYSPGRDEIEISVNNTDGDELLSVLMHEIQHAIQQREGFAKGGMPDGDFSKWVKGALDQLESVERERVEQWKWRDGYHATQEAERASELVRHALMYESALRLMSYANRERPSSVFRLIRNEMQWIYGEEFRQDEEAQELQRAFYAIPKPSKMRERNAFLLDMAARAADLLKSKIPDEVLHDFRSDERTTKSMVAALRRQADLARKELEPQHELERAYRNAQALNKAHKYSTPFDIYKALAGEVEARNTQSRLTMNEDERRAKSPIFTADVPAEQVIVMFGGLDIQAPMASVSAQPAPRGSFNPATNTVALLKGANLSTFLHETGHMGLEMMIDLAGSISSYEADQLSDGEKGILRDVSTVLEWFGVRDITEWSAMSFEERRGYHERFAESFERYLLEGKAPSVELQPFFGKFRRWMLDVYKSVKAFLQKNPGAGDLSAEVRQVFDRMIATDEQIETMRRLGTLSALFSSADQAAAMGVNIEDWDAYQALASGQIDEAKELLSARALRDMKWLSRAKSRELRKLQKEAALLRAGVEMEVRPDVLRRPIYRAWQFLTARMSEDDRLPKIERPKSDPDAVDPALDSLFVAIAKLGGIDRAELESEWGLDPKERIAQAGFGKHVLRRTDGRSIDEMRSLLVQYGYLDPNESSPDWNPREFEERFFEELNGSAQYSSAADFDALQDVRPGDQVINLSGLSAGRFDAAALQSMGLPADVLERMRTLRMTSSNGLHPDIVADMLVGPDGVPAFGSGDQLVRELAAAVPPAQQIAAEVDAIMLERHGEFATREALEDAVDAAVHNNLRLRLIATQYAALTKARGDVELIQRAARDVAKRMVSRQAIKALRPDIFSAADARAGKASERAIQAGDVETAAKEQRNQLVNAYASREARRAKEDIAKTIKTWKELVGRSDKRAVKSYDVDVLNAVRVILGAYGIGGKQTEKASEYLERVKAYDPELYAVLNDYASRLAAADMVKPVNELTVEQFEELKEGIGAMLELARSSRTAEIGGDAMDIADIQAELMAKAEEIGIPDRIPGEGMAVTPGEAKLQKLKSALAAATRMEQWVDMFDAATGVGPARRYLFMHVNSAANNYRADKVKYLRKFRELIDPIASTLGPKLIHSDELGYTFGKDTGGSAVNEILHALLHTGNSSNKRKLLLGRGWAKEVAPGVLDTSSWDAFVRRMADEGHITKEHMDFVQGVWDLLEETKPLAQKAHRAIFGLYFAEVTAEPVSTPWGVYRGGYVPAIVDTRANADASLRAMAEDETQSMSFAFPSPASGFTKSRVEYNAQLLLDLRSLTQHIDKVLMFAHMAKPVRDVKRMIGGDFGKALGRINKEVIPGVITPFLNRSAKQIVATPIPGDGGLMGFFATLRSRAGMAAMIANLTNTAQQVTGFSLAAVKVKPTLLLSAAAQFVQSPREFIAAVTSASIAMDHRFNNSSALIGDQISELLLNPSLLERGQAFGMRHAYFMQAFVDAVMSSIIWTAAYNQAVERGSSHDDAVALADSTIRTTQGSMLPEDLARFEAGNHFVRLFTQFAGYFNMQANLIASELVKRGRSVKREGWTKDNVAGVSAVMLLAFLAPAVVAELIVQAFRGGPDDEDKDGEWLDDWLASAGAGVIRNAAAMVPVVGQLANAIYSRTNSKPYDDRVGTSPALSMIESAASAPFSIAKAVTDDGSSQKAIRETGVAISMILGLPVTPLTKPLGYAAAVEEGRVNPTSAGDYARGLVTGVASPESK